jgi:two-component system, NtrC family, nitrogen regulation sensor histidine kinase NtrY
MFNRYELTVALRVIFLVGCSTTLAFSIVKNQWVWAVFLCLMLVGIIAELINFLNKTNRELSQFLLAVQYRDFSQQFSERHAPVSVRQARRTFNVISHMFKQLASEKEEQFQYLQKILELVDTGILSYSENGDVGWMNEALKKMLNVPYIKNISALEKRDEALLTTIRSLQVGKSQLVSIRDKQVLLAATAFRLDNQTVNLVAFQNVNQAVNQTENQAYQRLLRVMTHEIMNSVAPIASLADTLSNQLDKNRQNADHETLEDVKLGISTIKKRSEGLLKFSDTYRNLSKISKVNFDKVFVRDLFETVEILMENNLSQKGIELDVIIKDLNQHIEADATLIEQILINLITNAIDAVKEQSSPEVRLSAYTSDEGKNIIEVRDNGSGISSEMMEQIFVPFFTTKKQGSGIGLSLSKQIMALHQGTITVSSIEGEGSIFRLIF